MNIDEAKELLKAGILTDADLDALLAAEWERCAIMVEMQQSQEWSDDWNVTLQDIASAIRTGEAR